MLKSTAMAEIETRYAPCGDLYIAYQVVGDGSFDLVFLPTWQSNVEILWESPAVARFLRRLASFSRLIVLDRRGSGLSDSCPVADLTIENRGRDVVAVLDAVGSERAALLGSFHGGTTAAYVAAAYPERVSALTLFNSSACLLRQPGYDIGLDTEVFREGNRQLASVWGRSDLLLDGVIPKSLSLWWQRYQRMSLGPATAAHSFVAFAAADIRAHLGAIRAPTMVVHRTENRVVPVTHGRYLAEHIPGARFVQIEGQDPGFIFGEQEGILAEVQEFLIGSRAEIEPDRELATVLFTDLVGSTQQTAAAGDRRWLEILDTHDEMLRSLITSHGGKLIKTTGDGVLATFARPSAAIRCGRALAARAEQLGLSMRIAAHTGEIERRGEDIAGLAVVIAQRALGLCGANEMVVTGTVRDVVIGSTATFEEAGTHALKGVPGRWPIWKVTGQQR